MEPGIAAQIGFVVGLCTAFAIVMLIKRMNEK